MEYVQEILPKISLFRDADVVNNLKHKIIRLYKLLLCAISKGYLPEYELILLEISLVQLLEQGYLDIEDSLFIIQYYLNND